MRAPPFRRRPKSSSTRLSAQRHRRLRFEPLEARTLLTIAPFGAEIQANTFVTGSQYGPDVAGDASGNYVIVWEGGGDQDGDEQGIFGQRFNSDGQRVGNEFLVNTTTNDSQNRVAVAMDADGDFVVVWSDEYEDGDDYGIFAQRFSAAGVKQGPEFQVNQDIAMSQDTPDVGMDAAGNFVVVWESETGDGAMGGIVARRYAADGTPQGDEFVVNTTTAGNQSDPALAVRSTGEFVVAWTGPDANLTGIYAQRFNAAGQPVGGEISVNTHTTGMQHEPSVGIDADGDFLVAWDSAGQDGSGTGVFAQRFTPDGQKRGDEFRANVTTAGNQRFSSVAMDADGDFLVTWHSPGDGSSYGVFGRRFDAAGVPQSHELQINTFTDGNQTVASAVAAANGSLIVAWASDDQDGDMSGIFAQQYRQARVGAVAVQGEIAVNTTTNLAQQDPAVAADANGNYVVVWEDAALDGSNTGIFGQRFDGQGTPQGDEFQVNTATGGHQVDPDVAMMPTGEFVVVWSGPDAGILFQRYAANGLKVGDETMTDAALTQGEFPAVTIRDDGQFIVAWRELGGEIVARRFAADGDPLDDTFQVSASSNPTARIDVAVAADGDFVITWDDSDGSLSGVFARVYNADGTPKGTAFPVNQTTNDQQAAPSVDMDANGNFTVAWRHFPEVFNLYDVYMRRFDAAGNALGDELLVNTHVGNDQLDPSVGVSDDGAIVVAWYSLDDQDGSGGAILARQFDAAGEPVADEFIVNTFNTNDQDLPAIAVYGTGDFVVAWQSAGQDGNGLGVFAQRYDADFLLAGLETHANKTTTDAQLRPSVAQSTSGNYVVAWDSPDQDGRGIFAQLYAADGTPIGDEFQVNNVTDDAQIRAQVAMDNDGNFVVAWDDAGNDGTAYGIFARRYNSAGVPQGLQFQVNVDVNAEDHSQVAMDADGDFVVVWDRDDGNDTAVWARAYNANGTPKAAEFQVNQEADGMQRFPAVAIRPNGNFVVAWESQDQDGDGFGVYARRFNAAGIAQGDEFPVNTTTDGDQDKPKAGMDALGNFVVTWNNVDDDVTDAQRFNAAGAPQGSEFTVNPVTTGTFASLAMNRGGQFLATWVAGKGTNFDVFAALFAADGTPLTPEYRVNTTVFGLQQSPDAAAGDQFLIAWDGNGPGDSSAVFFVNSDIPGPTKFFVLDAAAQQVFTYDAGGDVKPGFALIPSAGLKGIASNPAGDRMWVIGGKKVTVLDTDGNVLGSWKAQGLTEATDIAMSGTDIWIVDRGLDQVLRFTGAASRLSGKTAASSTFDLHKRNKDSQGIVVSGGELWVVNDKSGTGRDKVFHYNLAGVKQATWKLDATNTQPTGITLDPSGGSDLWVVDAGTDRVYQYNGGQNFTGGEHAADAQFDLAPGNTDPQGIADPPLGANVSGDSKASSSKSRPTHSLQSHNATVDAVSDLAWAIEANRAQRRASEVPSALHRRQLQEAFWAAW